MRFWRILMNTQAKASSSGTGGVMHQTESDDMKKFEVMATHLMHLVFSICQQRTRDLPHPPKAPEKTLSAAAVTLQEAIKTFIEASRIK